MKRLFLRILVFIGLKIAEVLKVILLLIAGVAAMLGGIAGIACGGEYLRLNHAWARILGWTIIWIVGIIIGSVLLLALYEAIREWFEKNWEKTCKIIK